MPVLSLLALAALLAAFGFERWLGPPGERVTEDLAARADRAARAMQAAVARLSEAREKIGAARDPSLLPGDSPLLGTESGPLVTTLAALETKRLAASPDWARVLTIRMDRSGVGAGSFVAASFSGSFPGLNLALIAACEALGADLAAVSSVTASSWGACEPGLTWPEMELLLVKSGAIRRASVAISAGGLGDRALDLEPEAQELARDIASRTARELGVAVFAFPTMGEAAAARMHLYESEAQGRPVSLYVNVGGAEVSLGLSAAILRMRSGFLPDRPFDVSRDRGVIARFVERGVPVLSLLNVRDLALRWGVAAQPASSGDLPVPRLDRPR